MKFTEKTLEKINKVYAKKNPSTYLNDYKKIKTFTNNRKNFLHKLKLPSRIFKNSTLIDFGCGSGQNTIVYNILGSNTTLVEYDKQSIKNTVNLFKKFSKSKYKIIKSDIFKYKSNKKYDFVVSNGVIHHTKDPKKNIDICCKYLKKGGFFILGWGEVYGFFQRNIQRIILYSISQNRDEIIKYSKILFRDHLLRSVKFSGRKIDEIIFDTYINPKINAVSLDEIVNLLSKNGLDLYSSYEPLTKLINFSKQTHDQFRLVGNKKISKKNRKKGEIFLNNFYNFSLSSQQNNKNRNLSHYSKMSFFLKKIVDKTNDVNFFQTRKKLPISEVISLKKILLKTKKEEIIDINHNFVFLKELNVIFKILESKKEKIKKFKEIRKLLNKSKKILKGKNGVGMNYIVGYKR
jgi:SAM-dependent methyltransferase